MRAGLLACAAAITLGAAGPFSPVSAQIAPRTPAIFLEKAYFSFKSPTGKGLFFEGQPTVHYFLWNRLSDIGRTPRITAPYTSR